MASMIPKVILFILSSNSITYGPFLSSSNLRTLNNIGCYSVGKRTGFTFFFGAFLFETGGKKQPCLAARKSTENMQHLLHYELVTDTQDKLGLVRRMCKKLYALHLNIHNNFPDSLSSCWSQPHQYKNTTTTRTQFSCKTWPQSLHRICEPSYNINYASRTLSHAHVSSLFKTTFGSIWQ